MRTFMFAIAIGVCLGMTACAGGVAKEPEPHTSTDWRAYFHAASRMDIQYGDGNSLSVTDKAEINRLTSALDTMKFAPVAGSDGVGQNFVVRLSGSILSKRKC